MQTMLTSLAAEVVTEPQKPAPWVLCVMLPLNLMLLNVACLAGECRPTSRVVVCRASRRAPYPALTHSAQPALAKLVLSANLLQGIVQIPDL